MKKSWTLLLIAVAVLAPYAPALRNGFVWDDHALVLRDPLIRSWRLIPAGFEHFLFTDATPSDFYRPIQRLTYTLEYCAVALRPAVFHFMSILCHLAAAIAFYFFALELLRVLKANKRWRDGIALIATVVWAVHPINSSAVIYISGRADPLAAAFGFAGLYCALRILRADKWQSWLLAAAATVAFLLSALSKEMGLIFPLLWCVILVLTRNWRALRSAAGVIVCVLVIYFSLRLPVEHIPPPPPRTTIPLLVRPIIVARAAAEYASLLVWPVDLHMDRDVETHPSGFSRHSVTHTSRRELQTLLGLILIAGAMYAIVRFRKERAIFVCAMLTLASYLPVSGIFLLNATVAEHWMYLPSAFLFLTICLAIENFLEERRRENVSRVLITATIVVIGLLATRTFVRTFDWKDQRIFLERTVASGGDSSRMLTNLGRLELSEGKLDLAKKHLQAALQKDPDQPFALLNLGVVAIRQNDLKSAHDVLKRAVQSPIVAAKVHELLAVLELRETGNVNLLRLRLAARTGPPDWSIEKRYIKVLEEAGFPDRAIAELKLCLRSGWFRAESWQMLSELLAKTGQNEAAAHALAIAQEYDVHLSAVL